MTNDQIDIMVIKIDGALESLVAKETNLILQICGVANEKGGEEKLGKAITNLDNCRNAISRLKEYRGKITEGSSPPAGEKLQAELNEQLNN